MQRTAITVSNIMRGINYAVNLTILKASSSDECSCSTSGISGGISTGIPGCQLNSVFNVSTLDPRAMYCYINGGSVSKCPAVYDSTMFPGAAFRRCQCNVSFIFSFS